MPLTISNAFFSRLEITGSNIYIDDMSTTTATLSGSIISVGGGGSLTPTLWYDASNTSSYAGTGTTIYNIGSDGNASGTTGTLSGVTFDGTTANGILDFDGGSDRITFSTYNFGTQITVSAWIYPRTEYSINTLLANAYVNQSTNGFKMGWNNWNTTNLRMNFEAGNGSSGGAQYSAVTIVEDEWQHIAYVFDQANQTIAFFRNGTQVSTESVSTPVSNIGMNNTWNIGSMMGAYYMDAKLGELKVFKSLLSSSDLSSEYNNSKSRYGL